MPNPFIFAPAVRIAVCAVDGLVLNLVSLLYANFASCLVQHHPTKGNSVLVRFTAFVMLSGVVVLSPDKVMCDAGPGASCLAGARLPLLCV